VLASSAFSYFSLPLSSCNLVFFFSVHFGLLLCHFALTGGIFGDNKNFNSNTSSID
jgi:hypothetical protein